MKEIFIIKTICLAMGLVIVTHCFSEEACNKALYSDMLKCSQIEQKNNDQLLNMKYSNFREKISKSYGKYNPDGLQILADLKNSELSWIQYRDYNCKVATGYIDLKSIVYETTRNLCLAKMSLARSQELDELAKEY